ncbi:MAG: hypothetical protein ABIB04_01380 [Patescibacteria group bacterium]
MPPEVTTALPEQKAALPPSTSSFRIKPKIGKNVISCSVIASLAILILLFGLLYAVAKTGLVKMPFFSRFYTGPIPTRLVQAEPMTPEEFSVLLGGRFFSEALEKESPPYVVSFNERELTGVIMMAIDIALRDASWKQIFTQIVIRPTDFEFLSKYERGVIKVDLLMRFKPDVVGGRITLDPVSIQIGDYKLPATFAYRVASYIFSRDFGSWELNFGEAELLAIRLFEGRAEVMADVTSAKP